MWFFSSSVSSTQAIRRLSSLLRSDCEEVAEQCGVFKDKVSAFMNGRCLLFRKSF
jgi:hypothetical protein